MKKILLFAAALAICCSSDSDGPDSASVFYRDEMRNFVIGISQKAKAAHPGFAVIPQNGIELVIQNGEPDGPLATAYLDAIDGHGQEDLFFGYDNDNVATAPADTGYLTVFLDRSKAFGNTVLVTDYCWTPSKVAGSDMQNSAKGYVSFAAPDRELSVIPGSQPNHVNSDAVTTLADARNFLYLINNGEFASKTAFVNAVAATNYDLIIIDLFYQDEMLTPSDIAALKQKPIGGQRLVVCYMSVGEAEDYRYYWNQNWASHPPQWLAGENPDWPGNYKVRYWDAEWQNVIYLSADSYLIKILAAGFDGVYLDIIDAFEYFE